MARGRRRTVSVLDGHVHDVVCGQRGARDVVRVALGQHAFRVRVRVRVGVGVRVRIGGVRIRVSSPSYPPPTPCQVPPSVQTYNTLMSVCARASDRKGLYSYFKRLQKSGNPTPTPNP